MLLIGNLWALPCSKLMRSSASEFFFFFFLRSFFRSAGPLGFLKILQGSLGILSGQTCRPFRLEIFFFVLFFLDSPRFCNFFLLDAIS